MKKNNLVLIKIFYFILLIGATVPLFSQEALVQVAIEENTVTLSARFLMKNCSDIVYNILKQGLKSQIFFQIRIYEKGEGFFWFLGDSLVFEADPWYLGYIDFFENEYIIEGHKGQKYNFKNKDDFFDYFFTITDYSIKNILKNELSCYYLLLKIHLDSVRIVAPFTLLSLFSTEESFTTEWHRIDIK